MTNSKYPLRLNVGFIINQPIGYYRDFNFEFPDIHLKPDLDLHNLVGVARFGRTPQGLLLQAKFQGSITMECVRCLAEAPQSMQTEFSELYAFSKRTMSESGLILAEDGNVDLEPLVRDYLMVEVPIRPLCRPDCKGLCPVCGEDLNVTTCEHSEHQLQDQSTA